MKTENEINKGILETTMVIDEKFPELLKYIDEMPITIPNINEPEINETNLRDYQSSLDILLNKYATNHIRLIK